MEKEFITPDDFINSLIIQTKEHAKNGKQRFIREILLSWFSVNWRIPVLNMAQQLFNKIKK